MIKNYIFLVFLCITSITSTQAFAKKNHVFQYSTIHALLDGLYDGDMTFRQLKKYGDFGLGTFNGIDGEMIALDGVFYQLKSDGKPYVVSNSIKTPFSVVSFFSADKKVSLPPYLTFASLEKYLDTKISSEQYIQAIRIEGTFKNITVRSIPKQTPPYRRLAEVSKADQVEYTYKNITGTIVGYRFPSYMKALNVPGYHLHFISKHKTVGGHVLSLTTKKGIVKIQQLDKFNMQLPKNELFTQLKLHPFNEKELQKIEKSSTK